MSEIKKGPQSLKKRRAIAAFAASAGILVGLSAGAQETGKFLPGDLSKTRVEMPVKGLLNDARTPLAGDPRLEIRHTAQSPTKAPSTRKSLIRMPVKSLGSSQKPASKQPSEKVEPGKIRWHKAIQTAMNASRQSGKPVLLFQMMGHLDDRFC